MTMRRADDGMGLVEVVIAFFLLAIIAVALLPALWSGIQNSVRQSDTATATRQLNALVETARQSAASGSCSGVNTAVATHRYLDGSDVGATATVFDVQTVGPSTYSCAAGATHTFTLTATDKSGVQLATVTATVFVTAG